MPIWTPGPGLGASPGSLDYVFHIFVLKNRYFGLDPGRVPELV